MLIESPTARDCHAQDHYAYRINALIEGGRDDLATQVVAEARQELGSTTEYKDIADFGDTVVVVCSPDGSPQLNGSMGQPR